MGDVHSLTLFRYSRDARDSWRFIHVRIFIKYGYVLAVNVKYLRIVLHRFKYENKNFCYNL